MVIATDTRIGDYTVAAWLPDGVDRPGEWPIAIRVNDSSGLRQVMLTVVNSASGDSKTVTLQQAPQLGPDTWVGIVELQSRSDHLISVSLSGQGHLSEGPLAVLVPSQASPIWGLAVALLAVQALAYGWWLARRAGRALGRTARPALST
ncbi:MAG TPA: hypothetical protein VJR05_09130 [Acidimicrobiia bacterium]|nr:hypothetical protein [Acidimicrobiia bacterium]